MNLYDFIMTCKRNKRTAILSVIISFIVMILYTIFFNNIRYEITSEVSLQPNLLLTPGINSTQYDIKYMPIEIKSNLDNDMAAIEYIENQKAINQSTKMLDYQLAITNLTSKDFMHAVINSQGFKDYLIKNKLISSVNDLHIVEQSQSLSFSITGSSPEAAKKYYQNIITATESYIESSIKDRIRLANDAIKAAITKDTEDMYQLINDYNNIKATTGFHSLTALNQGVELLNSIADLSLNADMNYDISNKFDWILENSIKPSLLVRKTDYSGLNYSKKMTTYIIVELIASLLIGIATIFVLGFKDNIVSSKNNSQKN